MAGDHAGEGSRPSPRALWFVLALLGVVAVQVLYGLAVLYWVSPDMATRGQFGDIFGGVNAAFTGLAFAGVIYTILLQRRELELQRDELRLTRDELARSATAQGEQVEQLRESARLAALTALLNVNSANLEPMRELQKEPMRDLAAKKADLGTKGHEWSPEMRVGYQEAINRIETHIVGLGNEYGDLLKEQEEIIGELKRLRGSAEPRSNSPTS